MTTIGSRAQSVFMFTADDVAGYCISFYYADLLCIADANPRLVARFIVVRLAQRGLEARTAIVQPSVAMPDNFLTDSFAGMTRKNGSNKSH